MDIERTTRTERTKEWSELGAGGPVAGLVKKMLKNAFWCRGSTVQNRKSCNNWAMNIKNWGVGMTGLGKIFGTEVGDGAGAVGEARPHPGLLPQTMEFSAAGPGGSNGIKRGKARYGPRQAQWMFRRFRAFSIWPLARRAVCLFNSPTS
jgi:hypothetical protein